MRRKNLKEIISFLKGKRVLLTCHRKPDIDSIASLFVFSELLPGAAVAVTAEKDESARSLMEFLGMQAGGIEETDLSSFDGLVVLDTSSGVLAPAAKKARVLLLIDHHQAQGRDISADIEIIDENAPATSEIVGGLLCESGMLESISKKAAFALSCGIVFDTARFKSARKETFAVLARLMERAEADYEQIRNCAEPERKRDERLAILRGFQRTEIYETNGYIIATSNVGSGAGEVATMLAEAAHAAFVAEWKEMEKETRISARAGKEFKLPLNEIAANAAEKLGGKGGGHRKAAGLSVKNRKPEEVLKACLEALKEKQATDF